MLGPNQRSTSSNSSAKSSLIRCSVFRNVENLVGREPVFEPPENGVDLSMSDAGDDALVTPSPGQAFENRASGPGHFKLANYASLTVYQLPVLNAIPVTI